jgi:two-component system, chemotaxis family, response regulator WspF
MAIRIGIVNDVLLASRVLRRVLQNQPDLEVVWDAADGVEAVQKCMEDRPDIVLMDLVMPNMNGVEATRRIMIDAPCAVLIVTSTIDGHLNMVYEAMGYGALDVTTTPVVGDSRVSDDGEALRQKIRSLVARLPERNLGANKPAASGAEVRSAALLAPRLVLLGASTGGPAAIHQILRMLPSHFNAAVVVAQHIDPEFVKGLGDWLATASRLPIQLTAGETSLKAGQVYLLDSRHHAQLVGPDRLSATDQAGGSYYRPSIDLLFGSAADVARRGSVGVLLTGMGRDGAQGLLRMRQAGLFTISQSADSCVVYGMPRAAEAIQASAMTANPDAIGDYLIQHIQ